MKHTPPKSRAFLQSGASLVVTEGQTVGEERRRFGRRTTFKRAEMIDLEGVTRLGIVVDMSEGGARIRTPEAMDMPATFDLKIPEDDFVVLCETVHRHTEFAGVRFIQSPRRISWKTKT